MRMRRIHDERATQVNSHRRQMFGREEPDCSIQRLGGRAAGRPQTSGSRSTFAGREKDRGNAKLLRRKEKKCGLEERGREEGREGRVKRC